MIKQTVCPNCGGLLRVESHGWICKRCKGFISLQDGKFYEYVEKPFVPPMTNADRIRAMSDEEMARFLAENEWECETYNDCAKCPRRTDDGCVSLLKWLKQPAEE